LFMFMDQLVCEATTWFREYFITPQEPEYDETFRMIMLIFMILINPN